MTQRDMEGPPLGNAGASGPSIAARAAHPDTPGTVWVLEDARRGGAEPCLAIAERLGLEFRRVPLRWTVRKAFAALARQGSLAGLASPLPLAAGPPVVTLSAGRRTATVAAWLKHACGSRMVHYGAAGLQAAGADLRVVDAPPRDPAQPGELSVLGPPHRISALSFQSARLAWQDRLGHLPRPRLALLVGSGAFGAELPPSETFRLAAGLAEALHGAGGAILAAIDRGAGREATDSLAAGLARCMNLIYRQGEPGPDPELGFLALADAVVVIGDAPSRLLRACALPVPVYVAPAGPMAPMERRLQRRLLEAGQVRLLDGEIGAWPRTPLDEADRAARVVREVLIDAWQSPG